MPHTRTGERLGKAAELPTKKDRSDDLDKCKTKFGEFTKQFKPFIQSLKNYHTALVNLEHNRSEMLEQIEVFTKNTKLFNHAGKGNKVVKAAPAWAKTYSKKEHSYCSSQRQLAALNNQYAHHVDEYLINYVNEWEIIVTTRVEQNTQKAEELKKSWLHYDKKFKALSGNEAKLTDKGKQLDPKAKDKLVRNEEKLDMARQEFEKQATTTCHIIDAAVDAAWMDVTPIVYRLANMEIDRMGGKDSAALTKSLQDLVARLKDFSKEHKINLTAPGVKAKKAPKSSLTDPPKRTKSKSPTPTKKQPKRFLSMG